MYRYKRLLVGIHLDDQDKEVVRYAAMITNMAWSDKLYFLDVISDKHIDETIHKQYPQLPHAMDEAALRTRLENVTQYFDGHAATKFVYEIAKGKELTEILDEIHKNDIDLLIVPRKDYIKSDDILSKKCIQKAPCSVLIIPEGTEAKITKILVAVDFSEHSADAMEVAIAFASASGMPEIYCLHVYDVPMGYYETGRSYEEFSQIMLHNVEKDYQKFMTQFDLKGISVTPLFLLDKHPDKAIQETIDKENFDLVILGAWGRTSGAAMVMGSVVEELIAITHVPLLAIKDKAEGLNILKALFKRAKFGA